MLKIEITKTDNDVKIFVKMPVWTRIDSVGQIYAALPLLGIETFGKNTLDLDLAITESLQGFFMAAEKYGRGIEAELKDLGWNLKEHNNSTSLEMPVTQTMQNVFNTGQTKSLNVHYARQAQPN